MDMIAYFVHISYDFFNSERNPFSLFLQSFMDEKIDQTVMSVYLEPDQTVNYYSLVQEGALWDFHRGQ